MVDESIRTDYERWLERADECSHAELAALAEDDTALTDAFYRDLAFGTGGLRGIIGPGPNRMNVYTVARATQGLADYLNARFDAPSVAIARDSRLCGGLFARTAAQVLAANGIRVSLYPRIEPTPALSFAVRDLGASAGICVTASHNPSEYNGYKVYGADGCQITTQAAADILTAISAVDIFDDVKRIDFYDACDAGLISWIAEDTLARFLDAVAAQSLEGNDEAASVAETMASTGEAAGDAPTPISIVYTPLNGTGMECVQRITRREGIDNFKVVPEQAEPDGRFPSCPYPNPEIREALELGLDLAAHSSCDLLLATDPDADRCGIAVPDASGELQLVTGNELGILLIDYICRMRAARGEDLANKVVITTIVSSAMADALAADYGFELRRTLTGFKYIGEQIGLLEQNDEADRFIFGFEESYGYLAGTHARDKDAIVTSMLVCEMARHYKREGKTLLTVLDGLYERYGRYRNGLISVQYPGAEGAAHMDQIMRNLRQDAPAQIAGYKVTHVVDYAKACPMPVLNERVIEGRAKASEQVLPAADVVEFQLEDDAKVIVRPSGTEPKIKAYLFAKGELDALDIATRELLA